ncbi:hypothetical protein BAOM_3705 [Peribacillus asahii]|uniref:Uncharacterized protein n=1 Tax=Peribacillus asahii TaxID=228899 RepID=A0A3T0KVL3_9BACI|nr:hypothetical protein BAOM_3705 [Peribacillus asahii]
MDSYLVDLNLIFIKKFDYFCNPYSIKAPFNGITETVLIV